MRVLRRHFGHWVCWSLIMMIIAGPSALGQTAVFPQSAPLKQTNTSPQANTVPRIQIASSVLQSGPPVTAAPPSAGPSTIAIVGSNSSRLPTVADSGASRKMLTAPPLKQPVVSLAVPRSAYDLEIPRVILPPPSNMDRPIPIQSTPDESTPDESKPNESNAEVTFLTPPSTQLPAAPNSLPNSATNSLPTAVSALPTQEGTSFKNHFGFKTISAPKDNSSLLGKPVTTSSLIAKVPAAEAPVAPSSTVTIPTITSPTVTRPIATDSMSVSKSNSIAKPLGIQPASAGQNAGPNNLANLAALDPAGEAFRDSAAASGAMNGNASRRQLIVGKPQANSLPVKSPPTNSSPAISPSPAVGAKNSARNLPASYRATKQPLPDGVQLGPGEFLLPSPGGVPGAAEQIPHGALPPGAIVGGSPLLIDGFDPTFGPNLGGCDQCSHRHDCRCKECCGPTRFPLWGLNNACRVEEGVGTERVPFAPQVIEISQPSNSLRMRVDLDYGWTFPDRSEYFWAKQGGRGPALLETEVDMQELKYSLEVGGPKFSATTELPIRILDPEQNLNTTGFSDMSVATKLVLVDGDTWQITQFFKTTMPTGSAKKGLGTGHTTIEPGFLFRHRYSKLTNFHYEIRYWVPLGSDLEHSGQVLRYGAGVSRLLYESDDFALIPTIEFVGWSALDGRQTNPFGGLEAVDPIGIFTINPGMRMVYDMGCDLGLLEVGLGAGFAASTDHWEDSQMRLELKWTY